VIVADYWGGSEVERWRATTFEGHFGRVHNVFGFVPVGCSLVSFVDFCEFFAEIPKA
jgi:hypothetical protein